MEEAVKTSTDFASEQIPLFIQELLAYNFVMSLSCFILGIILMVSGVVWSWYVLNKGKKNSSWYDEWWGLSLLGLIPFIIGIGTSISNLEWVKIKLAPRVYLMEYVKDTLK